MKTFKFNKEGLNKALQYKDYTGIAKETIENHSELFPIALGVAVIMTALIIAPAASTIAYKTSIYDSAMVAFKYINGGF